MVMMKILVLLGLVFGVLWMLKGRRGSDAPAGRGKAAPAAKPQAMLACAHCGVHLPQSDVLADAAGRSYCSEAHRLAGPG
jgi:uncharacterized protein